ncbi:hypothetical protein F4861DRAFT_405537 [Xylaria intraflava]|nr:hypothetical protein F4861DRAFT_405537 [Xylaria intraflava]
MSEQQVFDVGASNQTGGVINIGSNSLFLSSQVIRFSDLPVSRFAFLFQHPRAQKLVLYNCSWGHVPMRANENSLVKKIDLVNTSIDDGGFNDILVGFSNLRELSYSRPVEETGGHFDLIGNVLREHGSKLEHLTMINDSLMSFDTAIGSLGLLESLKTIEISLELLIGFRKNPVGYDDYGDEAFVGQTEDPDYNAIHEQAGDWSLVNLLPTSLEKLTLYVETPKLDVYFNTHARYGAKLEALLTADCRFAKLISVKAPNLDGVVQRIDNRLTSWLSDGMGTIIRLPHSRWTEFTCFEKAILFNRISADLHPEFVAAYHRIVFDEDMRYSPDEHINCTTNCYVTGYPSLAVGNRFIGRRMNGSASGGNADGNSEQSTANGDADANVGADDAMSF